MARAERSSALAAARLVAWDAGRIFLREVWTWCSGTTMQFVPLVSAAENRTISRNTAGRLFAAHFYSSLKNKIQCRRSYCFTLID
jgi:hypothetical protein